MPRNSLIALSLVALSSDTFLLKVGREPTESPHNFKRSLVQCGLWEGRREMGAGCRKGSGAWLEEVAFPSGFRLGSRTQHRSNGFVEYRFETLLRQGRAF